MSLVRLCLECRVQHLERAPDPSHGWVVMENLKRFLIHGEEPRGLHLYCTLRSEHHKAMPTCLTEGGWQEISGLVINTVTAACQHAAAASQDTD